MALPRLIGFILVAAVVPLLAPGPSTAQTSTGKPVAYTYADTLGQTGLPWQRSNAHLNQPWGVGADGLGVWIANRAGRNLLRFGDGALEELGRAGDLYGIYDGPTRAPSDVAVVALEEPPLDPGQRPRRVVWYVDAGSHVAVGTLLDRTGSPGVRTVLGTPDTKGDRPTEFSDPEGIAASPDGTVFVSDTGNHRVQIFASDRRHVATLGRTGSPGSGPNDLNRPARLALSSDQVLFVADAGNHRIVAYDVSDPSAPRLRHIYGRGIPGGGDDSFDTPLGLSVDDNLLYVADTGNERVQILRRHDGDLRVSIGDGSQCGPPGGWSGVSDVAVDTGGNLHLAVPSRMQVVACDWSLRPRGDLTRGVSNTPYVTRDTLHNAPASVVAGPEGGWAVIEGAGQRVVRYDASGQIAWTAGQPGLAGSGDGSSTDLAFSRPRDGAFLSNGRLVVSDSGNGRLVVLESDGSVNALWGESVLQEPAGLAALPTGGVAVADRLSGRVQRFDGAGRHLGPLMGPAGPIAFISPTDAAIDSAGNWYVSEAEAHSVRSFDAAGAERLVLGTPGTSGPDFGFLTTPSGLAIDAEDRVLVVDSGNDRVQVFAHDGAYLNTIGGRRGGGTGGLLEPSGVSVASSGRLAVADTHNHRVQLFDPASSPWRPESINGFGTRTTTSVEALTSWEGALFAGVASDSGAAILRRTAGSDWAAVAAAGFDDPSNRSVTGLAAYQNELYAGVENVDRQLDPTTGDVTEISDGGSIWRTPDGLTWQAVARNGLGDPDHSGLGPFGAYDGHLYAGTRTVDGSPPELLRSTSGDAGTWQALRIHQSIGAPWASNVAVTALADHDGALVLGTCNRYAAQVWRSTSGTVWQAVGDLAPGADPRDATPALGAGARCVTSLQTYDGYLYAALGAASDALARTDPPVRGAESSAELWRCQRCDGTDWEPGAAPGFGDEAAAGPISLAPFDEPPFRYLYAAVGHPGAGVQVWRALDGQRWEDASAPGFGDDNNAGPGSGAAMAVHRGRLYTGTTNRVHGGELWSTGGTRPDPGAPTPGPTATPTPRPRPSPAVGRAQYVQADSWPISAVGPDDLMLGPIDMALAADGTAYILDARGSRVLRVLPDGNWATPFGGTGSGPDRIARPGAVAVDDSAGTVYVSDLGTDRLLAFDRGGRFRHTVRSETRPVDIDVLPDGTVWIADLRGSQLRHLNPDGTELEAFGRYASWGDLGFVDLAAVAAAPDGRVWVADESGGRVRAYAPDGAGDWVLTRTLDMTSARFPGCSGARLQALTADLLLAGACLIEGGQLRDRLPDSHRGSDLDGVHLRTARIGAGIFASVAFHDLDPNDDATESRRAVVRYLDAGFDIVTGYTLAASTTRASSGAADAYTGDALFGPFRLDVLPNGDVVVMDVNARKVDPTDPGYFQRFSAEGQPVEQFGVRSYPATSHLVTLDPDLTVATGRPGRSMGVALVQSGSPRSRTLLEIAQHSLTHHRRYCSGGSCLFGPWVDAVWDTTLINLTQTRAAIDYNYAATFEHTRRNYVLLQLWADNPLDVAMPARLYFFPEGGMGRKTEIPLDLSEKWALWTDVDAAEGFIYVLDTLNDRVLVLDAEGNEVDTVTTPKDAWKVAGGPNGEVFVLTTYGHVVRLDRDGNELSRFVGLPNDLVPPTALTDLGVDAWGRVFTIDDVYSQVTVFEPEGIEDDVLEGDRCSVSGDKWVAPDEILLGDTARLHMSLFGTCGFVEEAADIVLMINAKQGTESTNLRVARQILSVVDLDRHRVGVGTYVLNSTVELPLTQDRTDLIRAVADITTRRTPCGQSNTYVALRAARDIFADSIPGRRKLLVLVSPDKERRPSQRPPFCPWTNETVGRAADDLKATGIRILAVNGYTAACSDEVGCNIPVPERGQGVGRPAVYQAMARRWPPSLAQTGALVDRLPDNIDYVPGSANPPATWDAAARTLTWSLDDLPLWTPSQFSLTIRPQEEGDWPTNVEAAADLVDGWGQPHRRVLPVPRIRVYGELPPTPTPTQPVEPTPTPQPGRLYLPIVLRTEACKPDSRYADVALVIDTSGSMSVPTTPGGPLKLGAAREAARTFIDGMTAGRDQAAVVQFNSRASVVQPLTSDLRLAASALDNLVQSSGTRIDSALEVAQGVLTSSARNPANSPVLILLTDGEPSGTTPDEVRTAADSAKAAGLLLFTIGLGRDVDHALLRDVASRPDWYYPAPDTADLSAIYAQIAYEIPCEPMWP